MIEVSVLIFEYHQDMLAVVEQEVEEAALHHIHGRVQYFAVGTVAIGFAALAKSVRKSAAQEQMTGCELIDA